MKKIHPLFPRLILSGFVILYLLFTIKNLELKEALLLCVLSIFLLIYTYFKPHNIPEKTRESSFPSIGIPLGAFATHFLSFEFNVILAAGIVGFLGSFLVNINKERFSEFAPTIYCGAFIGMSTVKESWFIVCASAIAMLAYIVSKSYVTKVGGRLGTFAFIGVLSTVFLLKLWHFL